MTFEKKTFFSHFLHFHLFVHARRAGTCLAASPLVRHMLLVDPAKRANVEDICSHWYVSVFNLFLVCFFLVCFFLLSYCVEFVSQLDNGIFNIPLAGGSMKATENPVWKWLKNWPTRHPSGSIYSFRSFRHRSRLRRSSSTAPKQTNP